MRGLAFIMSLDNYTDIQEEIIKNAQNNPSKYLRSAKCLEYSARVIMENSEHITNKIEDTMELNDDILCAVSGSLRIYFMLIGFSFENLLEGIYLANNPNNYDDMLKKLPPHNLMALVKEINTETIDLIVLDSDTENLLNKISLYSKGKGRYPAAKKQDIEFTKQLQEFKKNTYSSSDIIDFVIKNPYAQHDFFNPNELILIQKTFNYFKDILEEKISDKNK